MNYLTIKDWQEWQSYRKDRGTPPWIKVHRCLLSNPKWAILSDAEKGQLISIWIVAADNGGQIPNDGNIVRKICQLDTPPNLNKFKDLKFFEQEDCQLDANLTPTCQPLDAPETETEVYRGEVYSKETEVDIFVIEESRSQEILNQFDIFWQDFPTNGRNKGSKKDAESKFKIALKKSTFNEIMDGVNNYAIYIASSGQSNQDAFRWLEKERWKDDYTIGSRIEKPTIHDNVTLGIQQFLSEHGNE